MSELYKLNADDTTAWNTHEIRSHRAPKRPSRLRRIVIFAIAIAMSAGSVTSANSVEIRKPAPAESSITALDAVPRVAASVSRSTVRRAPTRVVRINRAINYALAQRGDRYRFGAAGPSRWDCSGLVMKSFGKAGVKLPHYTGGIIKKGKKISKRNLKRGDIVFPQRGHVGIYLGGGKIVHASSGKGKVVVSKLYGFYMARRVL